MSDSRRDSSNDPDGFGQSLSVLDRLKKIVADSAGLEAEIEQAKTRIMRSSATDSTLAREAIASRNTHRGSRDKYSRRDVVNLQREMKQQLPPEVEIDRGRSSLYASAEETSRDAASRRLQSGLNTELRIVTRALGLLQKSVDDASIGLNTRKEVVGKEVEASDFSVRGLEQLLANLEESIESTRHMINLCVQSGDRYRRAANDLSHQWEVHERLWREDEALLVQRLAACSVPIPQLL